jgi:hypothetical protein
MVSCHKPGEVIAPTNAGPAVLASWCKRNTRWTYITIKHAWQVLASRSHYTFGDF